jgi:hypothetical protein
MCVSQPSVRKSGDKKDSLYGELERVFEVPMYLMRTLLGFSGAEVGRECNLGPALSNGSLQETENDKGIKLKQ